MIFENAIKELLQESSEVFKLLDERTSDIRNLEISLQDNKIHFPFTFELEKAKQQSEVFPPEDEDLKILPKADGYVIVTRFFLQWDICEEEKLKPYRLFLVIKETKILFHGREEIFQEYEFPTICIFKKKFVETNLQTRLKYLEYLVPFVNAFRDDIKKYRLSIINNDLNSITVDMDELSL